MEDMPELKRQLLSDEISFDEKLEMMGIDKNDPQVKVPNQTNKRSEVEQQRER